MKDIIHSYKPFLLFLSKFILTYLVLTVFYQYYLGSFDIKNPEVDTFTKVVANQTEFILKIIDDQSYTEPHLKEPSIKLFYKNQYVSRVIEGCNGISVMILFVAFIIAFSGKWSKTVGFIFIGLISIHVMNVLRIAFLSVLFYYFPDQEHVLHGVLFPLIIYGYVFLLWFIWVNKFSKYAGVSNKK